LEKIPEKFWTEAVVTAAYNINRIPNKTETETEVSPYEIRFTEKSDLSHLRIFGSIVFGHVSESQETKLEKRAEKMVFVGFTTSKNNYRLLYINSSSLYL
jgi:hypothetical protein